ncbi:hypothetical protein DFQ30_001141 [Apophysomyces sp. BC1015]|nr:hypothetical protein DFQ30_001141 [Apophysomyces sp. BC1015]
MFWPVAAEFDTRGVIDDWLAGDAARRAALPVIVTAHEPMAYHAWSPGSPMKEGRYRIPVPAREETVVPDLLLAPCVGFDASRYRLGYGGGYFDRTLAAWPPQADRPVTVGVAYECARVDRLPHEAHDLPLDVIVTDKEDLRPVPVHQRRENRRPVRQSASCRANPTQSTPQERAGRNTTSVPLGEGNTRVALPMAAASPIGLSVD